MKYDNDELQHEKVIQTLKSLPRLKTPDYFNANLMRRIHSEDYKEKKQTFWERFLVPSKLIPSLSLAAAAVLLLFVFENNVEEYDNPLLESPRVREDVIVSRTTEMTPPQIGSENPASSGDSRGIEENRTGELRDQALVDGSTSQRSEVESFSSNGNTFAIQKSGLNFRQVILNDEERAVLNQLRERIKNLMDRQSGNR
jgi:hypothetical protein